MIAKLKGILESLRDGNVVIDVQGVGYLVFCSAATQRRLPAVGDPVSLLIETHVREDHIHLYGFANPAERDWFRLLQTVQGVGAKVALAILSAVRTDDLVRAVAAQDKSALTQADGVGPKLALRIVMELKDKVGGIAPDAMAAAAGAPQGSEFAAAAVSALVNLGYKRAEAFGAIAKAGQLLGSDAAIGDLIRAGLKELGTQKELVP
jgi:Holliday junction DNA helicase RuvA